MRTLRGLAAAVALCTLCIGGCATAPAPSFGVAAGDSRAQACQRACTDAQASAVLADPARATSCTECSCDRTAGGPAVCLVRAGRP